MLDYKTLLSKCNQGKGTKSDYQKLSRLYLGFTDRYDEVGPSKTDELEAWFWLAKAGELVKLDSTNYSDRPKLEQVISFLQGVNCYQKYSGGPFGKYKGPFSNGVYVRWENIKDNAPLLRIIAAFHESWNDLPTSLICYYRVAEISEEYRKDTLQRIELLVKNGVKGARYIRGKCHYYGFSEHKNYKLAVKDFETETLPESLIMLANMYAQGKYFQKQNDKAGELLIKAYKLLQGKKTQEWILDIEDISFALGVSVQELSKEKIHAELRPLVGRLSKEELHQKLVLAHIKTVLVDMAELYANVDLLPTLVNVYFAIGDSEKGKQYVDELQENLNNEVTFQQNEFTLLPSFILGYISFSVSLMGTSLLSFKEFPGLSLNSS